MTKVYSHLSAEERVRIDELRNRDGLGVCQIALRIGRDKSTVSREPGRGPWFASDDVLLQCLFDRFGSVFPQCGLMVFPGVVIVSR